MRRHVPNAPLSCQMSIRTPSRVRNASFSCVHTRILTQYDIQTKLFRHLHTLPHSHHTIFVPQDNGCSGTSTRPLPTRAFTPEHTQLVGHSLPRHLLSALVSARGRANIDKEALSNCVALVRRHISICSCCIFACIPAVP